jgi:hypothetical protein
MIEKAYFAVLGQDFRSDQPEYNDDGANRQPHDACTTWSDWSDWGD